MAGLPIIAEPDYGPLVRRTKRGEIRPTSGVIVEDRPDPDAPRRTVRGARRVDPLHALLTRRGDDKVRYESAERYRDDVALANGARPDRPDGPGGGLYHPSVYGPSDVTIDATTRVREATDAIPDAMRTVFLWVVVGCLPIASMPSASGRRHAELRGNLLYALDCLSGHYKLLDMAGMRR